MSADRLTIDELERWRLFGARWRVVAISPEGAVVDLCTCTGEAVERRTTAEPTVVEYLRSAHVDPDGPY